MFTPTRNAEQIEITLNYLSHLYKQGQIILHYLSLFYCFEIKTTAVILEYVKKHLCWY